MNSTVLPNALRAEIEEAFGAPVANAIEVKGGEINCAAQVAIGGDAVFVKWQDAAAAQLFGKEARGLELLRATQTLRIPRVLAQSERFLALEWIDEGIVWDKVAWSRAFAEGLAALHRAPAPATFGLDEDNFLGNAPQNNTPQASWPAFWRECRLVPQIEVAKQRGIGAARLELLQRLLDKLDVLLDYAARPSLVHGDLWSGNYLAASAGAVLVDPAAYYGDREAELALIELFGGFPTDFLRSYHDAWPLEEGYERRRPIHQMYYLLTHFNHFGEPYGQDIERVCRRILS